jgi:hypothetical protein
LDIYKKKFLNEILGLVKIIEKKISEKSFKFADRS